MRDVRINKSLTMMGVLSCKGYAKLCVYKVSTRRKPAKDKGINNHPCA
jgi:hypothetical protein